MSKFKAYFDAVNYLEGIRVKKAYMEDQNYPQIYLKRMRFFLDLFGNPDKGFKFVHITGTAGKGTVSKLVHSALQRSGKGPVGLLSTPSVTTMIEKIQVDDYYIDPLTFAELITKAKAKINRSNKKFPYGPISSYELLFIVALQYFKKMKCHWIVLEVFAGGRYDATNAIETSEVCAITNIDYDHIKAFGPTLKKIAWEKAGIIKPRGIFFTTERRPAILKIFEKIAKEQKSQFHPIDVLGKTDEQANLLLAQAICRQLDLPQKSFEFAADSFRLPGRFEAVQYKPRVILDGAHNIRKIKFVAEKLKTIKYRKLILIVAILADKKFTSMLKEIVPFADVIIATSFNNPGRPCVSPIKLSEVSKKYKKKSALVEADADNLGSLNKALDIAQENDLILATGSFFLVGTLRKQWYSEESVLTNRQSYQSKA